ncbi:aromatic ring-hydroxylating oxygenase subunit alpha [Paraburkholderia caribensis]|uniref:aromatic ring-hydroxylating oxygenase subunit alpha n=1 Tax=Paraburkholderia caribensis TaxID=75105 RepID=UPI001CAEDD6F|nr:aromatic ring-hydroxylating dioxygenase subunit alpha [Paraburkholderia caribensis]CAG9263074.1 Rieske (2Fe-2S) domain-containing protein [Paraburkholderia caribensis]
MTAVAESIREDSVHSSLYVDTAVFAREMERIFGQGWVYVGHESELPRRGDYVRRSMGLEPVIVSRAADGIHVVANRCAHRGNLLCQAEQGNRKVFACQYHGWVFSQAGALIDVPLSGGACAGDRERMGLKKARVDSYRGFIFATFAEEGPTLAEHLGHSASALDRACDLSPVGEVSISGPWVKHLFRANWKMLSENEADGYHVGFVHDSFAKAINVEGKYSNVLSGEEDKITAVVRYLGNGHTELDYGPTYERPMAWLGVRAERYPEYVSQMQAAYGEERAQEIMRAGPPHAFIFPNLFLAETCLVMIQPLSVGETINMHVPMRLAGVPEPLNQRILRQGEVALGPSAFLTADDAIIAERQWRALTGSPGWLDLSRGKARETKREDGVLVSHYTDETPNRGFWRHYRSVM